MEVLSNPNPETITDIPGSLTIAYINRLFKNPEEDDPRIDDVLRKILFSDEVEIPESSQEWYDAWIEAEIRNPGSFSSPHARALLEIARKLSEKPAPGKGVAEEKIAEDILLRILENLKKNAGSEKDEKAYSLLDASLGRIKARYWHKKEEFAGMVGEPGLNQPVADESNPPRELDLDEVA